MMAAVASHRLRMADDRIIGHAAPADGPSPCVLRLEADGSVIAIARATRFSADAAAAGVRRGWCGVELAGLHLAAALADVAQVRCHASGRLLFEADTTMPLFRSPGHPAHTLMPAKGGILPDRAPASLPTPAPAPPMTVLDLMAHARQQDGCSDIDQILPFANATLRSGGIAALIDASYRSLLYRVPDAWITAAWVAKPPPDPVRALLLMILTSPEYREGGRHFIPGPFHPAFAFDRAPLDD